MHSKIPLPARRAIALCATSILSIMMPPTLNAADGPEADPAQTTLPLSEVILYSSGLGYFQRDGEVEGSVSIALPFKADDINDLLKSLVTMDYGGGQVTTVSYSSRDPLEKTLRSFAIDLTSGPSLGQLLEQVRGEEAELLRPTPLRGVILGVEKRTETLSEGRTIEREYLNVLTDRGLQSLPLAEVVTIKLLNQQLNAELRQALQALAAGHDTQKKPVTIHFDGAGKRKVSVAYMAQTPVWKTSYRLVLQDGEKPYFQGWAIVENTSDGDWKNVKLSLVSGRPISFVMDLYQPLYTTRPVVQQELYASLRPQVYGEAMEGRADRQSLAEQPMAPSERFGGRMVAGARAPLPAAKGVPTLGDTPALGRFFAQEDLYARGDQAGERLARDLTTGITAAAQGGEAGELFQYVINNRVNLARQQSAMLPIISSRLEASKVSIYNERAQPKHPLNGVRLKNTSPMHLMQGPITVFDANAYAGDARMEDLPAGQERLISYALDIKTEVEPRAHGGSNELVSVALRKGTLLVSRRLAEEKEFVVRNRDTKKKTVLIEHPVRAGWELVAPKEPSERTRDVYRFSIAVEPGKTEKLLVREQTQMSESLEMANTGTDVVAFYLRAREVSAAVKEALRKVMELRGRLDQITSEKARLEQRVAEIGQEQARIRENMPQLSQTSELYQRYVTKLDQQETELDSLRKRIESARQREAKQREELAEFLQNLEVL